MPKTLSDIMDFDLVVRVHPDGSVTEVPEIYAPTLFDDALDSDDWTTQVAKIAAPIANDDKAMAINSSRYRMKRCGGVVRITGWLTLKITGRRQAQLA